MSVNESPISAGAPCPRSLHPIAEEYRDNLAAQARVPSHVGTTYQQIVYVLDWIRDKAGGQLTRSSVQRAVGSLMTDAKRPRSASTAQHYLKAFRAFCRWASDEDNGYLDKDPTRNVRLRSASSDRRHERRPLTPAELPALLAAAGAGREAYGIPAAGWADRWFVLACTGVRVGTLPRLSVNQFLTSGPKLGLQIHANQEKGRRDRFVYFRPETAARVARALAGKMPSMTAFPMPAKEQVLRVFQKHLKAAGITYCEYDVSDGIERRRQVVDLHSLRYTFGTNLARAGVPVKVAQSMLGHADPKITLMIYTQFTQDESQEAVMRVPPLAG